MNETKPSPGKEQIALLEPFERLGLQQITLVFTAAQADQAIAHMLPHAALGFDTESKPTLPKTSCPPAPTLCN
jgi:hypothetical protein